MPIPTGGKSLDVAELLYPWTGVFAAQEIDAELRAVREACPCMDEATWRRLVLVMIDGVRLGNARGAGGLVE